jgi:hypothetical protein
MPINRIEVAIEADDIMEDAVPALSAIVDCLGVSAESDVETAVTSSETGEPVLFAVIAVGSVQEEEAHG